MNKKIGKFFRALLPAAVLAVALLTACDDVNSIHQKYLDRGEGIYLGVVDSLVAWPGFERVLFTWYIAPDPRIRQVQIFWNQRQNTRTLDVNRSSINGFYAMELSLDELPENDYTFEFITKDDLGNVSKAVECIASVYGQLYKGNLQNRRVIELSKQESGQMKIVWEQVASETLLYSVVKYTDSGGTEHTLKISNDAVETYLDGLDTGDEAQYYSVYQPTEGLDSVLANSRVLTMPRFERLISKTLFAAAFKPGDNTTPQPGNSDNAWANDWPVGDNRDIRQLWDDNFRNDAVNGKRGILHTEDMSGNATARFKFPHKFTFEIGVQALLTRVRFNPRLDAGSFTGHSPRFIELWATDAPKQIADFPTQADYETYYRTTYVVQKDPNAYLTSDRIDIVTQGDSRSLTFVEPAPATGINNWQNDWVKLGDFELVKPSGLPYNQRNDADNTVWNDGWYFNLNDAGKKVRYIRMVIKYPNWQNTNCINFGEITFWGDDV
ncbi:MAG: hypothetical protein LBR06_06705 [Bacteroidales bacterium]|jgi:hypothetical protein|nr:hypothetical protein [Bacteroidales bacterium]